MSKLCFLSKVSAGKELSYIATRPGACEMSLRPSSAGYNLLWACSYDRYPRTQDKHLARLLQLMGLVLILKGDVNEKISFYL